MQVHLEEPALQRFLSRSKTPKCASLIFAPVAAGLLMLAGCHGHERQASEHHLDFNQDVQPVLAARCFSCHGPDPQMRKGGLRLDLAEWAEKKRPGHPDAIVPGHPDQSELIKRIESKDPHHLMPQTSEGEAKPMSSKEIAVLRRWIGEGAVYRPHWAFETPTKMAVVPPSTLIEGWDKSPIDAFVLARMQKAGLKPSPEADKHTLVRRVALDLTGLLPTPAEVAAFVNDGSPQAYEHLVDGLLARPTFGEQRARYWLDYARYADTYGLHLDNSRHIWPYRDYVIRSFNSNKPFDQFAMEQIAGDLMPARGLDPLIASGYLRLGLSSNEGGAIPEELRVNIARERTEAFGATFMGLTVGCAVCHDHKFDPTTQKDFYSLTAFFNNLDEKPYNDDRPVWAPILRIPKAQNERPYNEVLAKRAVLAEKLDAIRGHQRELVERWLASKEDAPVRVSAEKLVVRLRLDEGSGDAVRNSAPGANPASFRATNVKPEWGETTWLWPDFRMQSNTRLALTGYGDYAASQAFSSGGWMMLRAAPNYQAPSGTLISRMDSKQHDRGWELAISKGVLTVRLLNQAPKDDAKAAAKVKAAKEPFRYPSPDDFTKKDLSAPRPADMRDKAAAEKADKAKRKDEKKPPAKPKDATPTTGIEVAALDALALDSGWKYIFFTYDGSGKAAGVKLYLDGKPLPVRTLSDNLNDSTIHTQAPLQLGWREPDANPAKETRYQDVRLYSRQLTAEEVARLPFEDYVAEVAQKPASQWNHDQWQVACSYYLNSIDPVYRSTLAEIPALDAQLVKLSQNGDLTLVSWEKPSLAYANVLTRGVYSARAGRVEANTPHYLPPLPADMPHNRLALAKWTVSPENPLTARVTVNRMWSELFGAGLVETTEDFGIMGQRPSHPELLDWLAVDFRESGWDVKQMYKRMVMSATYRQSARANSAQLATDPRNLLLSHGPRFRMDAEMLRDIALQSGGLLVGRIGGPSVKPYQPPNVWEPVGFPNSDTLIYSQDSGEALYRRSMYTFWKRMSSPPNMDAFDAPMRDIVCTRRQRTDTPLQALVTMDDVQWLEAARALAEHVILKGGKQPEQRIDFLSQTLLSHPATPKTVSVLTASLEQMEQHYSADRGAAHALVSQGESHPDKAIPEPELAAWTMIASEMLNLDETINK